MPVFKGPLFGQTAADSCRRLPRILLQSVAILDCFTTSHSRLADDGVTLSDMPYLFPPPSEITRPWTTDEIDLAISQLERRIHGVEALHAGGVRYRTPNLQNVEQSIRDTILEIFGIASPEFYRHEHFTIDNGPPIMGAHIDDLCALAERRRGQFIEGIPGAIARIRELIDSLEEKREELPTAKADTCAAVEGHSCTGD